MPTPLTFDEIKQFHERVKASGSPNGQLSLADFSQKMQQYDQDSDYSAGMLPDNLVGSVSRGIDSGLSATGLPDLAANVTGFIGSGADALAGRDDQHYEQIARGVGQGLPRMAADVGMFMGGAALNSAAVLAAAPTGGASLTALAPGLALMGASVADAGIKGYADSGSVKQGVTSAALMGLAPGIGSAGTKAGLSVLGKVAPKAVYSGAARVAAAQIGEQGAFLGAMSAEQAINGHNPFTMDNLFANAVGTVGFAPLMIKGGMDVYKATPKRKTWKPELGPDQSVLGGGSNDMSQLTNYLLGAPDSDIPNFIHQAGGLRQALELTGLEPAGMSPMDMTSALGQRMRGKELVQGVSVGEQAKGVGPRVEFFKSEAEAHEALKGFPEGSTVDKTGGDKTPSVGPKGGRLTGKNKGSMDTAGEQWRVKSPEQPAQLSAEWDTLAQEAGRLLQVEPRSLVDTLKIIQMANKFQTKFAREGDAARLQQVGEGEQTVKGKVKPRAVRNDEGAKYGMPVVKPAEGYDLERQNTGLDPYEQPKGVRPKAVKGKVSSLEDRLSMPEFSRQAGPLNDSNVFRFVKGPLTHDGTKFLQLGSAQVGASGVMHQNKFQSATQMPKQVFELVKQVYPEAWDGENVNVNKLRELEKQRPLFETHVYGQDGKGGAKAKLDQLRGELDILGIHAEMEGASVTFTRQGREVLFNDPDLPPSTIAKMEALNEAFYGDLESDSSPRATGYYNTISPFDTVKYPVVRIDVTVPMKAPEPGQSTIMLSPDGKHTKRGELWKQDDLHENLPNTLGWAMVQFVPHPQTGETVMFVAEQQSRWGQNRADLVKKLSKSGWPKEMLPGMADKQVANHPLLDLQHKLVLKAAMDEARKRGVTKMVVSDGETAMMTEKHDTVPASARGYEYQPQPSQAGGMRQHYDNVLQSAAEKMTRVKGETVDMGNHKNITEGGSPVNLWTSKEGAVQHAETNGRRASEVSQNDQGYWFYRERPDGSPVFRNADGTPKATATGKMYDISPTTVDQVRFSRKVEPSGSDDRGFFTTKSLGTELERLNNIEATPEQAQARLMQKVKNDLEAKAAGIGQAMPLMDRVFSNLGLSPKLKQTWMSAAQRVIDRLHVDGTTYVSTQSMDGSYNGRVVASELRGAYFPKERLVTVSTARDNIRNPELAAFDALVTLAHESGHNLLRNVDVDTHLGLDNFRKVHTDRAREFAASRTPQERHKALTDILTELAPGKNTPETKQAIEDWARIASEKPEEFLVEYGAALVTAKATAEAKRNFLRFVPEPLQNFVKTLVRGMDELKKLVTGTIGFDSPHGKAMEGFKKDLEVIYSKDPVIEGMKSSLTKATQAATAIEQGDIGGFGVQFSKVGIKALDERVSEHLKVRQSGGFVRSVMQHMQISAGAFYKEHFPSYNKVTNSLATMDGLAVNIQHAIRRNFMVSVDGGLMKDLASLPDGKLTKEQIRQKSVIGRIEASPKLQRVAFDTMLKTNELVKTAGETGGAYPTFDHPEVQAVLKGLTTEQVADVQQVYHAYMEANATAAQLQVKSEVARLQYVAADYLLGAGIPHDQAYQSGVRLFDALLSGDPRNIPHELLANEGAIAFMKHWEAVKPKFDDFQQKLDRPYFTEFRSGNWGVRYEVLDANGKVVDTGYRSTNDKLQWKAIQRDVASDPSNRITELMDHRKDPKGRFGQMQTRGLEEATNLVRAHYDAAMAAMRPEMAAMFEDTMFDPAQPLVDKANSELKTMALRRLAPGREKINMIAAQDAYSSLIARKLANTQTRMETNWQMKHESWNNDMRLKQEMQQFRDNVLSAGRQEFQTFRKLTTMLTMGGNVSSAVIDSLQPITMGLWRATQEVGTVKALKYTAEGFIEAFKPIDKMSDGVFKDILVQAINRGYLKTGGSLDNFMSADDAMNYNVVKARSNRDLVDMKEMLTDSEFLAGRVMEQFSKLGQKGMEVAMTPMRLSAQLNNKNALWVGYKMGLDKGLKGQPLFDAAVSTMQTINLQGQRAAHSSFKMKAGQANGLVEAATLMTNYPIAVFAEMTSSWQGMLKSSGLDSAARHKSMQAFAGQVLTQMAFAGVAGMGLKGLFQIAKEMFGVDAEEAIRQGTKAIDDSGTLGEVLLNGVINSTTGIDVASRFDLSGVGGLNPYTGFDAKGLFGAGGGMISALYNAPGQFAKGDVSKIQLIPTGFRRMMTAYGDDAYKDASGQQIINPTVNERFTQMLGFKPARMAQVLEQKSTMRDIEKGVSEKSGQRKAQLLDLMQQGKMPEVMANIQQDVLAEMQGVEYSAYDTREMKELQKKLTREAMLELVNSGVEKLLPFDPMASGTGAAAQAKNASAQGFGDSLAPRQSEQTRTVLKQQMMQQLGMKLPRGAPKAVRNAQMVDELIRQNPTMTRSQAIAVLHGQ